MKRIPLLTVSFGSGVVLRGEETEYVNLGPVENETGMCALWNPGTRRVHTVRNATEVLVRWATNVPVLLDE